MLIDTEMEHERPKSGLLVHSHRQKTNLTPDALFYYVRLDLWLTKQYTYCHNKVGALIREEHEVQQVMTTTT